ncbi:MAG: nitroreductase [Gammaproteobacteria bacterium]|nr:MAG: nitroreductase [Gammaproteobacteria bacterium]
MSDRSTFEKFNVESSPTVSHAIETRRSVRGYLTDPVPEAIVREILAGASRAASGGNLQPWKVSVLAGDARDAFVNAVAERMKETPFGEGAEYEVYPADLEEPYRGRRRKVAKQLYDLTGVEWNDKGARARQMALNFTFFGAPVGMFVSIDRKMGPPQFADLGIFLQSVMLLAREKGLHTCAQEAWSTWGKSIREFTNIGEDELVFCGVALGYADPDAVVNDLYAERASVDEFAHFQGF